MAEHTQSTIDTAVSEQYVGQPATNQGWTDLLGDVSSSRKLAGSEIKTVKYDYGTGVDFAGNQFDVGMSYYGTVQTDHRMALNQTVEEHIHFTMSHEATSTSKMVKLQIYIAGAGVFEGWTLLTLPNGGIVEFDLTAVNAHGVTPAIETHWLQDLLTSPAINTSVSSLYKIRIDRLATTNNYADEQFYLDFFDGHIRIDQERGSPSEYLKGTEV